MYLCHFTFIIYFSFFYIYIFRYQGELALPLSTAPGAPAIPKGIKKTQELYADSDSTNLKLKNTVYDE